MAAHTHDLSAFRHSHTFTDADAQQRERALLQVTVITLTVMLLELTAGWWSGSLALLADGWHMGTHALALGGAVLAYRLSARASRRAGYAFGGWKIEVLTAYTSGLMLMAAAVWIAVDAVATLRAPHPIAYEQAIAVAVFGLLVNLGSAWLLTRGTRSDSERAAGHAATQSGNEHRAAGRQRHLRTEPGAPAHDHDHDHDHGASVHPDRRHLVQQDDHGHAQGHGQGHGLGHGHGHGHDHNFRAAYLHVLADAFTSVLAIAALAGGLFIGWAWLDPAVALLGAAIIAQWSLSVLRGSAGALVDATADPAISQQVRDLLEADGDAKVADLHVWQVGARAWSAVISVVADRPLPAAAYRARLSAVEPLRHVTVEVHACPGAAQPT